MQRVPSQVPWTGRTDGIGQVEGQSVERYSTWTNEKRRLLRPLASTR